MTFTSSITDTSTGLQYMNARFYEPTTGRFISQDSYTGNAYDPWTQHLYSYCMNNPTNFMDPTGHTATSADLYKLASQYKDTAILLKKTSYNLLDAAGACSKMWKFDMSERLVKASKTIWKQSRIFYRLASSTREMADAMAKEEEKKPAKRYSEVDAVIDSIVGDIGGGRGIGASAEVYKVEASIIWKDDTVRYELEDGRVRYGMFQSGSANLGTVGAEDSKFHPFFAPCGHNLLSNGKEVWACEYCEEYSQINDDLGVGYDVYAFLELGGHIGVDIGKFFENFAKIGTYLEPEEESEYGVILDLTP